MEKNIKFVLLFIVISNISIIMFYSSLNFTGVPLIYLTVNVAKLEKYFFKTPYPYTLQGQPELLSSEFNFKHMIIEHNIEKEILYYKNIINYQLITEPKWKLYTILNLANALRAAERYNESNKYYMQALELQPIKSDPIILVEILRGLTLNYSHLNQFTKSKEHYMKLSTLISKNKDLIDELSIFESRLVEANIYEDKKDYLNAEKIYINLLENSIPKMLRKDSQKYALKRINNNLCPLYKDYKTTDLKNWNYKLIFSI